MEYTRKYLHQLNDGYYLRYVSSVNSASIVKIEDDIIYGILATSRHHKNFYHDISENFLRLEKEEVYKGEQVVYILSEEETLLFLCDFI